MNCTACEIAHSRSTACHSPSRRLLLHAGRCRVLLNAGVLVVSIVMLVLTPDGYATTFTVTGPDDPVPNGCLPDDCSLREALIAANGNANADVIEVPAGNYVLSRGKLTVTGSVQIHGAGGTTVEGDGLFGSFPVFDILGPIAVTLSNLTIPGHARAVDIDKMADATLEFVTIPEPDSAVLVTDQDGGTGSIDIQASEIHASIYCGSGVACRIADSLIWNLRAGSFSGAQTDVEILRSTLDGDLAAGSSGVSIQTNGTVMIIDSTIHNSKLGLRFDSGAPSSVLLDHLTYTGNRGPVRADVPASITVVDSYFSDNDRGSNAGYGAGAIDAYAGSTWDISRSTFAGNVGNNAIGGALLVKEAAHVTLRNSTFSGNSFSVDSADGARGAAIGYISDAGVTSLLLQHVTIVPPAIAPAGILGTAIGGTGGESGLALEVLNSIVRGTCSLDANAMDINFGNIESPGDTCDLDHAKNLVNVTSGALALGTLGDHGGAAPTYEPGVFSTALGNADSNYCLDTDQRGYQRPFGGGCDVGAVERGAEDRVFANGFE